jgi:hypothetical protein
MLHVQFKKSQPYAKRQPDKTQHYHVQKHTTFHLNIFELENISYRGRSNSVGIAAHYGLEGPEIESR